ncbi:hypothetical protein G9A89_021644 [Geosiphon pyriformis]|nr:hypothetical protein G9A89_021644 [Geosiphon pyriformis]
MFPQKFAPNLSNPSWLFYNATDSKPVHLWTAQCDSKKHYCDKQRHLKIDYSELSIKPKTISTELPTYDTTANLLTTSLSADNTSNLSTAVLAYLSAVASIHQLISSSSNQLSGSRQQNLGTEYTQNPNAQQYLSLLITPKDVSPNNWEPKQKQPLINNILLATIFNDKFLGAIFSFKLKKITSVPLFSKTALDTKLITAMYTDVKVDSHAIKLILDSCQVDYTASTCIITADGATKTPIGEINDLSIEINGIIVPIKALVMEAIQY